MTDIVTYCDVNNCTECPRYGDDCDGDKMTEHTDIISRADAIKAVANIKRYNIRNNIKTYTPPLVAITSVNRAINALPSAETHEIRTETHGVCLISRDDAIGAVCKAVCEDDVSIFPECDQIKYCDEIQALLALPSADADRPCGEFEICGNSNGLNGTMYYICSLCGTPIDPCDKFCRGCGAYMKGGAE